MCFLIMLGLKSKARLKPENADGKVKEWSYDNRNVVTQVTYDGDTVLSKSTDAGYRCTSEIGGALGYWGGSSLAASVYDWHFSRLTGEEWVICEKQ